MKEVVFNPEEYPHIYELAVRSYELDNQNIVNNSVYFNYFEIVRIDFLKQFPGGDKKILSIMKDVDFFVVHNDCDYFYPAKFGDILAIYSRVRYIKKSSFCIEHIIVNKVFNKVLSKGSGIIVCVDRKSHTPVEIFPEFRAKLKEFDKNIEEIND